jgi:YggT family protein
MNYMLARLINIVFQFMTFMILAEVLMSWLFVLRIQLPPFVYQIYAAIQSITGVILNPLRRVIPSFGGLDLTPIIALFLLNIMRQFLIGALI